jgi:6-phosphogluconolactonase
MSNVKVFDDMESVAQAASDCIYQRIQTCVEEKGRCNVVLPGGTSPARCLQLLAKKSIPWDKIHWFVGDERCYPAGHFERNDTMIREKLYSENKSAITNFHPIPAELGPEQGAESYAVTIDDTTGLDIVLLGMGDDGHTASLFPGNAALNDTRSVVPVFNSPKLPDERISISLSTLKKSSYRIVLVTGSDKHEALTKALEGEDLPVRQVEPDIWFVDEAAMQIKKPHLNR